GHRRRHVLSPQSGARSRPSRHRELLLDRRRHPVGAGAAMKKAKQVKLDEENRLAMVEFLMARLRLLKAQRQPLADQMEATRMTHTFNEKEISSVERMLRVLGH